MESLYVLIGGKAGFGIDTSSVIIARVLSQLGYRLYVYRDYPSLIRGGHTFSIIRASRVKAAAHHNRVDYLLALNQDTLNFHKDRLAADSLIIHDSDSMASEGIPDYVNSIGIPVARMCKEENAPEIMRNTCIIGSFCKASGINWDIVEQVLRKNISRDVELNLKIARRGYDAAQELRRIEKLEQNSLPILTGNEAIGLGLVKAGLKNYIAYPMTPSSGILHFLAGIADDFSLRVIHPESEISVMLMALGCSYAGDRVAVGTSGGGFCLMAEGLSFCGMAEFGAVIILGQRPGPSTGLPTYTGQTELFFALHAGQGEFCRFIVAPGDAEEAYFWSGFSMNMSQAYQIPSIILSDKTLAEGIYSFDRASAGEIQEKPFMAWDRKGPYKRYLDTPTGVSPLTFPPDKDAVIKVNSYEHDEFGITTEDPQITRKMQEKRLRKEKYLSQELENYKTVGMYGNKDSSIAVLTWGSNKGVCVEAAEKLDVRAVQPIVLWPFPHTQFQKAMKGVKKLICVENNAAGQLARLVSLYGYNVDAQILKYDGRPFSLDELEDRIKKELLR